MVNSYEIHNIGGHLYHTVLIFDMCKNLVPQGSERLNSSILYLPNQVTVLFGLCMFFAQAEKLHGAEYSLKK